MKSVRTGPREVVISVPSGSTGHSPRGGRYRQGREVTEHECPKCGAAIKSPTYLSGKKDRCPSCHKLCSVPEHESVGGENKVAHSSIWGDDAPFCRRCLIELTPGTSLAHCEGEPVCESCASLLEEGGSLLTRAMLSGNTPDPPPLPKDALGERTPPSRARPPSGVPAGNRKKHILLSLTGALVVIVAVAGYMAFLLRPRNDERIEGQGLLNIVVDTPPPLRQGWQRVDVPGVGTIDIPPSMEVRAGAMAEFAKKYRKQTQPELAPSRLIIQPKGTNEFDREALGLFVRIIFQPEDGADADEFTDLLKSVNDGALDDESNAIRAELEAKSQIMGIRILQWDSPTVERIGGVRACCQRYNRQLRSNPPVVVVSYRFLIGVKPWSLTISYREKEKDRWAGFMPAIVGSFRITDAASVSQGSGAKAVRTPSPASRGTHVDSRRPPVPAATYRTHPKPATKRKPATKPVLKQKPPEPTRVKREPPTTVKQKARAVGTVSYVDSGKGMVLIKLLVGASVSETDVVGTYRADRLVGRLRILAVHEGAAAGDITDGAKPRVGDNVRFPIPP